MSTNALRAVIVICATALAVHWDSNYSGRWPAPSIHFWGTGNVWRSKGEHHKTQRPVGHYIAQSDQQAVTFKTFVNVYSSSLTPVYGAVLDCGLTVERF